VRAGKAYISSLGTTGLLVASSAMLLVVAGSLFAFDGWPVGQRSQAEIVSVGAPDRVATRARTGADRRAPRPGRARTQARGGGPARDREALAGTVQDPVVSGYPAPDSAPPGAGSGGPYEGASGDAAAAAVDGPPGAGEGAGRVATGQLGGTVSGFSPPAGQAITGTGDMLSTTVDSSLSAPGLPVAP
jgi:hypothetical protein